jgi:hypothetical protein
MHGKFRRENESYSVRKPQNLVFKFSPKVSKRISMVELERGNDMVKNVERIY